MAQEISKNVKKTCSAHSLAYKQTAKRDSLIGIEARIQAQWEVEKPFEVDAQDPREKYMVSFPYPYMNGRLHLGHSFSLSKVEFAAGYQRLKNKNVLFPFAFHCTGMPIKASADKIKREVELFGKNFENYEVAKEQEQVEAQLEKVEIANSDPTKVTIKKGKLAAKSTGKKYQFEIMQSMNVPTEEIHKFADSTHWLYYFPPLAITDLKSMGVHVDWRRSFITTDINPYYDSFIQWQFNKLKNAANPKIKFGERYTIYSAFDGQACMDHDRSVGEGVAAQEYTGIKMKVLLKDIESVEESKRAKVKQIPVGSKLLSKKSLLAGRNLYYVAATLRPETMYGQTNCYVGVDITYGVYAVTDKEAWLCSARAAKNMAWQSLFNGYAKGECVELFTVTGWDLIGVPLKAPLAKYDKVYTLPMEGVLANKGTGVVTSVPSDSPDDHITLLDLAKKAAYYHVQPEWITPFSPVPVMHTPTYGDLTAVAIVEKLKIQSQKDKVALTEAKAEAYKEGFYNGVMIVGDFKGLSTQEAKPKVKAQLIASGDAFAYCEPDGLVVSRSGDECVVTLADQWYIDYGEEEWKVLAKQCLSRMETYQEETRNAFEKTLDWLNQWACSRSFGLGSKLPWDRQWLIESLSDSTIYMAYYTVAHLLQDGALDGSKVGPLGVKASDLNDAVWEYIMIPDAFFPSSSSIQKEKIEKLRSECQYFYPLDLRCSGKDLVSNHLTFFIYNHTAIFPPEKWPKAVRSNGHLLLNSEKMSKSTGNFLTLNEAITKYGADPMRFTLADAGDGLEDANFVEKTANAAILRLFTEKEWIEVMMQQQRKGELRTGPLSWVDKVFIQEMKTLVAQADISYASMLYRDALKVGFYDLQHARNEYRKAVTGDGIPQVAGEVFEGIHEDVFLRFAQVQTLIMAPISPHWSEYLWMDVLGNRESVLKSLWPTFPETPVEDEGILTAVYYLRDLLSKIRSSEDMAVRKRAKKKIVEKTEKKLRLFVVSKNPEWRDVCLEVLKECYDEKTGEFDGRETGLLGKRGYLKDKKIMMFVSSTKKTVQTTGPEFFSKQLGFDEFQVLTINHTYLKRELRSIRITDVELIDVDARRDTLSAEDLIIVENASPGNPVADIQ